MAQRARRGRGESSIFRREEDGLWVATVSLGYDAEGKRKRKTVYGTTKKEVQEKLDELRPAARAGTVGISGMTVAVLLEQWLKASQGTRAVRTSEEWAAIIKRHLRPRIGGVRLDKLNALHVERLYAEMASDGVGAFTVRSTADVLGIALNYAARMKLIPAKPAAVVPKPRVPKREILFLTDEQARALVAAGKGTAIGPLVAVALGSGCRQGELLALRWEDIDLRVGMLNIRKSLSQAKAGFVVKPPKTEASRRTVTLPPFATEVLTGLKTTAGKGGLLDAPVFCTRTGNYLNKKNVPRAFKSLVKRTNKAMVKRAKPIPEKVRFHDLRHTVASLLLSKGNSLRAVATRLGHANPTMTLRVYGHTMPGDDAKLAEALGAIMD